MTKYSEVHLKNCLLIQYCPISNGSYILVGLVDRILVSNTGGQWIESREQSFFQYRDKTSEYSEIYHEQLTSEHFLPYNYRSSTLPRISRNIGRLLRQCVCDNNRIKTVKNWIHFWAKLFFYIHKYLKLRATFFNTAFSLFSVGFSCVYVEPVDCSKILRPLGQLKHYAIAANFGYNVFGTSAHRL